MPLETTNFRPDAHAEVSRQIESLDPSAVRLTERGFGWQTAAYLVSSIKSGAVDIEELRANGIDLKTAVAICEAISARHARRAAALAAIIRPVAPKPTPVPLPETREDIRVANLSILHTLSEQIRTGYGCSTELHREGFSAGTAKELAGIINNARM